MVILKQHPKGLLVFYSLTIRQFLLLCAKIFPVPGAAANAKKTKAAGKGSFNFHLARHFPFYRIPV